MKKIFARCAVPAVALCILLAGCSLRPASSAPPATPAPTPAGEPAATADPTPAAPAPTAEPPAQQTPAAGPAALDYDEMRPVEVGGSTPTGVLEGYFTVSRDGKWGLIRADGTEILPCLAETPVARCLPQGHWMWSVPAMSWEEVDAKTAELEVAGEAGICPGHGGGMLFFFYDLDVPGRDVHALDPGAFRAYYAGDGPGDIVEISDEMWETCGDLLPAFSAHEEGEAGDPVYPGDPVIRENEDGSVTEYMYISREGWGFDVPNAQMAGFFYDEQLAPVQMPGGWTYVDRTGRVLSTADYYDPTYATGPKLYNDPPSTEPYYAAPLQNGYVAVRRGDAWGLLDAAGTEVIPCEEAGVAWEGTTLWIKQADGWHQSELPAKTP